MQRLRPQTGGPVGEHGDAGGFHAELDLRFHSCGAGSRHAGHLLHQACIVRQAFGATHRVQLLAGGLAPLPGGGDGIKRFQWCCHRSIEVG